MEKQLPDPCLPYKLACLCTKSTCLVSVRIKVGRNNPSALPWSPLPGTRCHSTVARPGPSVVQRQQLPPSTGLSGFGKSSTWRRNAAGLGGLTWSRFLSAPLRGLDFICAASRLVAFACGTLPCRAAEGGSWGSLPRLGLRGAEPPCAEPTPPRCRVGRARRTGAQGTPKIRDPARRQKCWAPQNLRPSSVLGALGTHKPETQLGVSSAGHP